MDVYLIVLRIVHVIAGVLMLGLLVVATALMAAAQYV